MEETYASKCKVNLYQLSTNSRQRVQKLDHSFVLEVKKLKFKIIKFPDILFDSLLNYNRFENQKYLELFLQNVPIISTLLQLYVTKYFKLHTLNLAYCKSRYMNERGGVTNQNVCITKLKNLNETHPKVNELAVGISKFKNEICCFWQNHRFHYDSLYTIRLRNFMIAFSW